MCLLKGYFPKFEWPATISSFEPTVYHYNENRTQQKGRIYRHKTPKASWVTLARTSRLMYSKNRINSALSVLPYQSDRPQKTRIRICGLHYSTRRAKDEPLYRVNWNEQFSVKTFIRHVWTNNIRLEFVECDWWHRTQIQQEFYCKQK